MTELSYYSIGENCETAFEIAKYSSSKGINLTGGNFFDWIVSEPDSLKFITKINDKNLF
jgi:CRISPR/Cas system CMR-associated protein Cmr1 (group 7 of RAMP superfamily)